MPGQATNSSGQRQD